MPIENPPPVYEQPTDRALLRIETSLVRQGLARPDSKVRKPRFFTRFTHRFFGRSVR